MPAMHRLNESRLPFVVCLRAWTHIVAACRRNQLSMEMLRFPSNEASNAFG